MERKNLKARGANVLLSRCAYIFHWSNGTYTFGNSDYRKRKATINMALKRICELDDDGRTFPYIIEDGRTYITVDGLKIDICDKMIFEVHGEYPHKRIIAARLFKDLEPFYNSFVQDTFGKFNRYADSQCFWSARMKSLEFEVFYANSLCYYRLHFKGNEICFISSEGKIYSADGDNYTEISTDDVCNKLDAKCKAARRIITKFCDYVSEI